MKLCAHAQLSSLGNETVKLGKLKGDSEFPTELKRRHHGEEPYSNPVSEASYIALELLSMEMTLEMEILLCYIVNENIALLYCQWKDCFVILSMEMH